jgi:hypothetical protein
MSWNLASIIPFHPDPVRVSVGKLQHYSLPDHRSSQHLLMVCNDCGEPSLLGTRFSIPLSNENFSQTSSEKRRFSHFITHRSSIKDIALGLKKIGRIQRNQKMVKGRKMEILLFMTSL